MSFAQSSQGSRLSVRQVEDLGKTEASAWNALLADQNPFLTYEYLAGLESCHCLDEHGWIPSHLLVYEGQQLIGAMPMYLRTNSYGEFVFDWSWADAYERAGGQYYPKLVSAIPFAPVQGPRLLVNQTYPDKGQVQEILINAAIDIARAAAISSFHCLFPLYPDKEFFTGHDMLIREGIQYHWHNRNYRDFDDFLDSITSKKRKQIKRERRQVKESGVEIEVLKGGDTSSAMWEIFYDFYCSTFYRRWGSPRLTLDFFKYVGEIMPDQTLLILARKNKKYVAGAFAMCSENIVYGRHWGCNSHFPHLHFELCYYQTIEYCIKNRMTTVDAGVQGEHKLSRGFDPVVTWSSHWFMHPGFHDAVRNFLKQERADINAYAGQLNLHLPYKSVSQGKTDI